jgi:hypothetical protein
MTQLVEIAKGWTNLVTDHNRELALSRLEICDGCEHKRQLNSAGTLILNAINSKNSTYYCAQCGCPLAALTRVAESECKAGKWKSASYY